VLDPAWRVPALVRHAAALGMDILCLQEVESTVFPALQAGLAPLGYAGIHDLKGGSKPDGCATFYLTGCFNLASHRRLSFTDGDPRPDSGHIAQLLTLEREGRRLAIANTHLKWDQPETPRDRQWGHRQISRILDALPEEANQVICGDLNVTPQSDVVETLRARGFDSTHRDCSGLYTCNSNRQPKLIDYIFFRGHLSARPVRPVSIEAATPLPSRDQPSDHLPLIASFDWDRR
jgi:endonuclease/exonuclease/phosphatase family metal-dependent hydrolase